MSRIYEALRLLQRQPVLAPRRPAAPERRRSSRRSLHLSVFVYGHSPEGRPFHEETEVRWGNDGGGLIRLSAPVQAQQQLLLTQLDTEGQRTCRVVHVGLRSGDKTDVGIAFLDPR